MQSLCQESLKLCRLQVCDFAILQSERREWGQLKNGRVKNRPKIHRWVSCCSQSWRVNRGLGIIETWCLYRVSRGCKRWNEEDGMSQYLHRNDCRVAMYVAREWLQSCNVICKIRKRFCDGLNRWIQMWTWRLPQPNVVYWILTMN